MGWPTAMAPPLTLTISGFTPSSRVEPAHHPERLVDLYDVELVDRDSFAAECFCDRVGRLRPQRRIRSGHNAVCTDLGQPRQPQLLCRFLIHHSSPQWERVPRAQERSNPGDYVTRIFDLTTVDEVVKAVQEYPMSVGYRESK